MSSDIAEILLDPQKKIDEVRGVLPMLFRRIMTDLNVTNEQFNLLMFKYMMDPTNGFSRDNKRRSYERSNLIKEMRRETMSFKVFLKCVKFLGPKSADFSVKLHWFSGNISEHLISFEVNDMSYEELDRIEEDEKTTAQFQQYQRRRKENTQETITDEGDDEYTTFNGEY